MITNNTEHTEDSHTCTTTKNKILKIVTHAHKDNSMKLRDRGKECKNKFG